MNNCPDCNRGLRDNAIRCACGWNALDAKQPVKFECAHMECSHDAIAKIKTNTGWAKVCHKHYLQYFQEKAEETCVALDLLTASQCREYFKTAGKCFKRFEESS